MNIQKFFNSTVVGIVPCVIKNTETACRSCPVCIRNMHIKSPFIDVVRVLLKEPLHIMLYTSMLSCSSNDNFDPFCRLKGNVFEFDMCIECLDRLRDALPSDMIIPCLPYDCCDEYYEFTGYKKEQ